ncbi:WD40/YVTN/BNR-like repeat-containing protein [Bacteroidota bacterium]
MKQILIILWAVLVLFSCTNKIDINLEIISNRSIDSTLTFRGIFAIDENRAFVSGSRGSVYKTENGGVNWDRIKISGAEDADFRDIHILPARSILLLSVGAGSDSKIYKSTDDGENWNIVYSNPYAEGFLNSFAFWNEFNGIVVGDPVDGHPFIIITKDGGTTWQEIDKTKIPPALQGEAGFSASGTCVAVYGDSAAWIGMGGPEARIFKTTDMGISWTVHSTPILSGENTTGIYSVFFDDEMDGFVLGGDYTNETGTEKTLAVTKNGGINWSIIESDSIYFQSCMAKINDDNNEIFVSTGPAATYYSSNGKKWNKLSNIGFHCLSSGKNSNVIWAAGSNGRVAKIY